MIYASLSIAGASDKRLNMQELITTFHIDWKLMLAQLVNFAIVLAVLYRFALKPLTKVLTERQETIEKSLQDAKDIEQRLSETEARSKQAIREAQKEASALIEQAKRQADERRKELLAKTKQDIEQLVSAAKRQIEQEKQAMVGDARRELGDIVVAGMRRIVGAEMSDKLDKKVIKSYLQRLH